MKKILLSILIMLFLPIVVQAINFNITNYYVDASIKENGDVAVKELMVLEGNFNGYERDIRYNINNGFGASGIEDFHIYGLRTSEEISYETFNKSFQEFRLTSYANNGESYKYVQSDLNGGYRYRMYFKTINDRSAFLITYTLKDVLIKHNDCVELYYNFLGEDFEDSLQDVNIRINYPLTIADENFYFWFKGDLTGSYDGFEKDGITHVLAKVKTLPAHSPVTFRTIIDNEVLDTSQIVKRDNNDAKETVLQEEKEAALKANQIRMRARVIFYGIMILTSGFYILVLVLWIYVYVRFDKERKPKFLNKYNRDFIDDYNVEVIDYLLNKKITPNALSASIMNLIYKKNIGYEELEKNKHYKFKLLNIDGLNDTEKTLVDFLFKTVGQNNEFTTIELKKYASGGSYNDFVNSYNNWQKKVVKDGESQNFYEKQSLIKYGIIPFLYAILLVILSAKFLLTFIQFANLTIFVAIAFGIYLATITKRTIKGVEHYAKWQAFKNFLNDFGTFELKELPEIVLWERYLVYATVFGLAKKLEKVMKVYIAENNLSELYPNIVIIHDFNLSSSVNAAVNNAYQGAISRQVAASRSSGSGHGGGFSSGGGFGGGGGGGRGF